MGNQEVSDKHGDADADAVNAAELLSKIRDGTLSPKCLSLEQRRACTFFLLIEDVKPTEIAALLGRSRKTIGRYIDEIRAENTLRQDPELPAKIAGQLLWRAEADASLLKSIVRDAGAPHSAKVEAIKASFEIRDKAVARAQSLGCLPNATRHVSADLRHEIAAMPSQDELTQQVQALLEVAVSAGDAGMISEIEQAAGLLQLEALTRDLSEGTTAKEPAS